MQLDLSFIQPLKLRQLLKRRTEKIKKYVGTGKFLFWRLLPVIFCQTQFVLPVVGLSAKLMDWTDDTASVGAVILIGFKMRTKSD